MNSIKVVRGLMAMTLGCLLTSPSWADIEDLFAGKKVIEGVNVSGRGGLLLADTAQVPKLHTGSVSGHFLYGSENAYDAIFMPIGARYSPMKDVEVSANIPFIYQTYPDSTTGELDSTGLGVFTFGGKYRFVLDPELPDFAVGANIGLGPLSSDVNGFGVDWNLKGIATYPVPHQGILLNGSLSLIHNGRRDREITSGANRYELESKSETSVGLSLGAELAFTNKLSGIVEVSANELSANSGMFAVGVRGGQKIQYQALIGPGLGSDAPDFWLGGGVMMPF